MAGAVSPSFEYPELYQHLAAIVVELAVARGSPLAEADALGLEVAERFRQDFGGTTVYCPKVAGATHTAIFEAWLKGATPAELARQFDYAEPYVNRIIRVLRAKRESRMQRGLFDAIDPGFPPE